MSAEGADTTGKSKWVKIKMQAPAAVRRVAFYLEDLRLVAKISEEKAREIAHVYQELAQSSVLR